MDVVEALDHTFQHTQRVIDGLSNDQYDDPTPCPDWTVRDLLNHMIGVVAGLGGAVAGQAPQGEFELSADPATQFADVAKTSLHAWRAPGALDQIVAIPAGQMPAQVVAGINLLDTATHTWDLATATGQRPLTVLPDDVAAAALAAAQQIISDDIRPGRFGPECQAADGADATSRLVAFLGRQP